MHRFILLMVAMGCGSTKDDPDNDTGETPLVEPDEDADGGPPLDPLFDGLRTAIRADLAASAAPGVSVAIHSDGAIVFAEAFGSARPDEDVPVTPTTLFHIGSTTKMLTAMALLQEQEDGVLSLDDSLAEAYPASEFALNADWNDQITLHHLLTHTSGLAEWYDDTANTNDSFLRYWHENVYFEYAWLMAPPDSFWNYNNTGFTIAGLVLESLNDERYPDLMRNRIFDPLGMSRTFLRKSEAESDGDFAVGVGYNPANAYAWGPLTFDALEDSSAGRPSGAGTWSTPSQMMAVADLLLNGNDSVLSDDSIDALTARYSSTHASPDYQGYGYGMMLQDGLLVDGQWQETPVWHHGGLTWGYTSDFWVLPEHNFAVSILTSSYGTDFSRSVSAAVKAVVDLGDAEVMPSADYDESRLDDHVGTYVDANNVGTITIARTASGLSIDMPDLEALEMSIDENLSTWSDTIFLATIDGSVYDLTFIGMPGEPSGFVKNRAFAGTREPITD